MIQAVLFDFGNVLYQFDNNLFLKNLSQHSSIDIKELHRRIYTDTDFVRLYETGLISTDQFLSRLQEIVHQRIEKTRLLDLYTDKFQPIHATLQLVHALRPHYRLGLVSNTSEADYLSAIRASSVFPLFDSVTLSFQIQAMKPHSSLFLDALDKLGLPPGQCVYIDDILEYAQAARSLGIRGIHYQDHAQLLDSLQNLGVRLS